MGSVEVLRTVAPIFLLAGVGWGLAHWRRLSIDTLTEVVMYIGAPCLVFSSLSSGTVHAAETGTLVVACLVMVGGTALVARLLFAASGSRPGPYLLPAMFMNAGNMLLPLCLFAFGDEGLVRGVIVFATMSVLMSSLGVYVAGGKRPGEVFRLPYIYAAVAGLAVGWTGIELPEPVQRSVALLGDLAIPLMLLALGARLQQQVVPSLKGPLLATAARMGGGYLVALLFVWVTGVDGVTRSVLMLVSVMPSAVINFVFAQKYGDAATEVAATVFVSTLVSLVAIPLVLAFGL